ncbi:MAG: hypothetical protein IKT65_06185 [Clostridia bacterium]|nr:hypothetical protein [Clostridia bacterium]
MKQIYDFDKGPPPYVSRDEIQKKLDERYMRIIISTVFIGAILMQTAISLLAYFAYESLPYFTYCCIIFSLCSFLGAIAVITTFTKTRSNKPI